METTKRTLTVAEKLAKAQEQQRRAHAKALCVNCGQPFGAHTLQQTIDCANARS